MTTDTLRAAAQNDEVGALIDRLEALADPEKEAVPSFADTDWRSLSWTCAKALRAALAAPVQEPTQWTEAEAINAAHAAGFAGTCWTMGPYELVHLLNMLAARPQAGQAGQGDTHD